MTWRLTGYSEIKDLGIGGSGRVVLAQHEESGRYVAIKYLAEALFTDPVFRSAFRTEARLLSEVDSPEIAALYEYAESDLGAAIVMELVDGVSLRAMLNEHGSAEPQAALLVLKGSLLGLAHAHGLGIVHRDYKPENVLVAVDGRSKLADFGIAARSGLHGMLAGTPAYMAPEQWSGAAASPPTDIYAATACFFECLTGHPPYRSPGDLAGLRRQHERAPIPAAEAPAGLRALIERGLAKEQSRRPQDALAFVRELEECARGAYGSEWEDEGRGMLARRAALLLALFPFGADPQAATALGRTFLGMSRRAVGHVLVAAGIAVVLLAGYRAWPSSPSGNPQTTAASIPAAPPLPPSLSPSPSEAPTALPPAISQSPSGKPKPVVPPPPPPPSPANSPAVPANRVLSMIRPTARWCRDAECGGNPQLAIAAVSVTTQDPSAFTLTFIFQPVNASNGQPSGPAVAVAVPVAAGKTDQRISVAANLQGKGCRFQVSMKASISGDVIPNPNYASPGLVTCT